MGIADKPRIQELHLAIERKRQLRMCYFEQTLWSCGYWKWGNFRQQCTKEYRTGETCGLKLVYKTELKDEPCKQCEQRVKKQRRLDKLANDVKRWKHEGNRPASIEKAEREIEEIDSRISKLMVEHQSRAGSVS